MEEEGGALSFLDVLCDTEDMTERVERTELCQSLRNAVETQLSPREKEIISLRYGLYGGEALTQRQVAERFSISRSYVSRIEKRAVEKLREALGEEDER